MPAFRRSAESALVSVAASFPAAAGPSTTRRGLIAGGATAGVLLAAPSILRAASAARYFKVLRDGDDFGEHTLSVTRSGSDVQVAIDIVLKVKVLGITAFNYSMKNREVWSDGRLVSMDSVVDDDGDPDYARAKAVGDVIEIDGSDYQGTVPGDAATTTYWTKDFLDRKIWINTQTGVPINVTTRATGKGEISGISSTFATDTWTAKGDNLDIVLHYVDAEWASVEFDAGGEQARYSPENLSPPLAPLWAG